MLNLCGYTKISSKINRQSLHELHDAFDALSIPTIRAHHGTVIKKIGDAFLATFKGYTVDKRLKQFRKVDRNKPSIDFVDFDSEEGQELLTEYEEAEEE